MAAEESQRSAPLRALRWVGRGVVQIGRCIGRWISKRWQMQRVRRDIRRMEARRRELCGEMGEKVYLLFQRNQVRNRDLLVLCEQIRDLDVSIDAKEEDYRRIYLEGVKARSPVAVEVADEALEPPSPAVAEPTAEEPQQATASL